MNAIRSVLRQARSELTVLEQIGEFVVLPFCGCGLLGIITILGALSDG